MTSVQTTRGQTTTGGTTTGQTSTGETSTGPTTTGPAAAGPHVTHDVRNQVPPLAGYDVADDPALLAAAAREGAGWAEASLHELGELAGRRADPGARPAGQRASAGAAYP